MAQGEAQVNRGKYAFARGGHTYFGRHFVEDVLGAPTHLYVYVDRDNALSCLHQTMGDRPDECEGMLGRDKDWGQVRGGFFVLASNMGEMAPAEALDAYFSRMEVEQVFMERVKISDTLISGTTPPISPPRQAPCARRTRP